MTFTEENLQAFKDSVTSLTDDEFFEGLTLNRFIDIDTMYAREYTMKNDFLKEEMQRRILLGEGLQEDIESTYKYAVFPVSKPVPLWAVVCTPYEDSNETKTVYHYKQEEVDSMVTKYRFTGSVTLYDGNESNSVILKNLRVFKLDAHYTRRPVPLSYEPTN